MPDAAARVRTHALQAFVQDREARSSSPSTPLSPGTPSSGSSKATTLNRSGRSAAAGTFAPIPSRPRIASASAAASAALRTWIAKQVSRHGHHVDVVTTRARRGPYHQRPVAQAAATGGTKASWFDNSTISTPQRCPLQQRGAVNRAGAGTGRGGPPARSADRCDRSSAHARAVPLEIVRAGAGCTAAQESRMADPIASAYCVIKTGRQHTEVTQGRKRKRDHHRQQLRPPSPGITFASCRHDQTQMAKGPATPMRTDTHAP